MTFTLIRKEDVISRKPTEWDSEGNEINWEDFPVTLWKFQGSDGNLYNTETPQGGTESDALAIILIGISE